MGELLLRMVFSLAVVVGLLILVSRVAARRFQGRAGSPVEVLHRQALSKSSGVAVVSVAGRVLVLGTTEHQVRVLTELDPADLDRDLDPRSEPLGARPSTTALPTGPATTVDTAARVAAPPSPTPTAAPLPPALDALLEEPDLVTLEELLGPRAPVPAPPYPAAAVPSGAAPAAVDRLDAGRDHEDDPVLPADPSYAAFATALREQLARGEHPGPEAPPHAAPSGGRHAAAAPALEVPPARPGGARAARPAAARIPAQPQQPDTSPAPAPEAHPDAATAEVAALRAALLAARSQVAASSTAAAAAPAPAASAAPAAPAAPRGGGHAAQPRQGALAGSVLSPQTWRQALHAVTGRAS